MAEELKLPPLFDNISDEELSKMSQDMAELVSQINHLRQKQLDGGPVGYGLSDDEVKEGIRLLVEIRRLRAGKSASNELPSIIQEKLGDIF